MANNIFISYDLNKEPNSQGYTKIIEAIKELGSWAKVQKSHWFVSTNYSSQEVLRRLSNYIDSDDSLIVIDAKNNVANWQGLSETVSNAIIKSWSHEQETTRR